MLIDFGFPKRFPLEKMHKKPGIFILHKRCFFKYPSYFLSFLWLSTTKEILCEIVLFEKSTSTPPLVLLPLTVAQAFFTTVHSTEQ